MKLDPTYLQNIRQLWRDENITTPVFTSEDFNSSEELEETAVGFTGFPTL